MKRFRYSLQAALDAAWARERKVASVFGHARRAAQRERAELAALAARECALVADAVRASAGAPPTVGALVSRERCLVALATRRTRNNANLVRLDAASDTARATYEEQLRYRRALERHRARRYDVYLAADAAREAADFDEANALQHEARSRAARNHAS